MKFWKLSPGDVFKDCGRTYMVIREYRQKSAVRLIDGCKFDPGPDREVTRLPDFKLKTTEGETGWDTKPGGLYRDDKGHVFIQVNPIAFREGNPTCFDMKGQPVYDYYNPITELHYELE